MAEDTLKADRDLCNSSRSESFKRINLIIIAFSLIMVIGSGGTYGLQPYNTAVYGASLY